MENPVVGRRLVQGFFLSFFLGGEEGTLWLGDGGTEVWGWEGEGEVDGFGGRLQGFFCFFLGEGVEGPGGVDGVEGETTGARFGCCGGRDAAAAAFGSDGVVLRSWVVGLWEREGSVLLGVMVLLFVVLSVEVWGCNEGLRACAFGAYSGWTLLSTSGTAGSFISDAFIAVEP